MSWFFSFVWRLFADMFVDIFKFDPKYLENEEKYKSIKAEILGESEEDDDSSEEDEDENDEDEGS